MSLNKFTGNALDPESKKEWMNINCNAVNGTFMYANYIPLIPQPPYQIYSSIEPISANSQNIINLTGIFVGNQTIPLSQMYVGKTIKVYASGNQQLGAGGPTAIRFYLANLDDTIVYGSFITRSNTGVNNLYLWVLDVTIVIDGIDSNNIASLTCTYHYTNSLSGTDPPEVNITNGTTTGIDITNGFSIALFGGIIIPSGTCFFTPLIIVVTSIY